MNFFQHPEFFDVLGFFAFAYVVFVSILALNSKSELPRLIYIILLIVGLIGIIVDGAIIYTFFLK